MIHGMTGFGSVEISKGAWKVSIEVKSVNHRYLDVSYYFPPGYVWLEHKVRSLIQNKLQRGRITIWLKIKKAPSPQVILNKELVCSYLGAIRVLKKEPLLESSVAIADIIRLPGVLESKESTIASPELWPFLEKGFNRAIAALVVMRRREGRSLTTDVNNKLKVMTARTLLIKKKAAEKLREKKTELTDEEFKSFQKSIDVSEEIIRLTHYINEAKHLLKEKEVVGKRIDFVAQEMQRETNTIGSKLQDKVVANAVISLKSTIEKIREQAQNVE